MWRAQENSRAIAQSLNMQRTSGKLNHARYSESWPQINADNADLDRTEKMSRAKAQRRKALPRFKRAFFAPLRLCAFAREIFLPNEVIQMHLSTCRAKLR